LQTSPNEIAAIRNNSMAQEKSLHYSSYQERKPLVWHGPSEALVFGEEDIRTLLQDVEQPCYIVQSQDRIGFTKEGGVGPVRQEQTKEMDLLMVVPPTLVNSLGDASFLEFHKVKWAYMTGAMANGIASEEIVIAMGKNRLLSSFGAAGLPQPRLEAAIHKIQQALPTGPYAFNLIHSPNEPLLERLCVDLFLKHGISTIEASAFMDLTPNLVYYRAVGLSQAPNNQIAIRNKIIAKVSRREVALKFLNPAPVEILRELVVQGLISDVQANLAQQVPMADDLTVEADSGGHTDNRPLVCLLPSIVALRDEIQQQFAYAQKVRVGAAGGIGTPEAALSAFMMGAAYVVTGSVNQSCVEAGASTQTKALLAQAEMTDVIMAPAADMFEMGVRLQVLKRGTLFPARAQKLFELYRTYEQIEDIPLTEREKIEKQIFRKPLEQVWAETVQYFNSLDPEQIERAQDNPKRKMALIFRWYLGLSSRWSNQGEKDRTLDYQIWCGPAMGAFNDWVHGSYLASPENRTVAEVARHIMTGTALLYRLQNLKFHGFSLPANYSHYRPTPRTVSPERVVEVHR
jgi:trans-AT polyketide synthase, acyltransferase and oxidoreductase domains